MNEFDMEDKKLLITMQLDMLLRIMKEEGLIIAIDKDNDKFMFLDREYYIKTQKAKGFEIPFSALSY